MLTEWFCDDMSSKNTKICFILFFAQWLDSFSAEFRRSFSRRFCWISCLSTFSWVQRRPDNFHSTLICWNNSLNTNAWFSSCKRSFVLFSAFTIYSWELFSDNQVGTRFSCFLSENSVFLQFFSLVHMPPNVGKLNAHQRQKCNLRVEVLLLVILTELEDPEKRLILPKVFEKWFFFWKLPFFLAKCTQQNKLERLGFIERR